jgi:Holliday junction resolvase RusA-like endonuclease
MPIKGKHSKYIAYENMIAGYINQQYQGPQIEENLITILKLYFPNKKMGDLHNYPKSICDGIEKSGIIVNDKQLKPVLLFDYIDKDNPRVEIELYPISKYSVNYQIIENK